MLLSSIFALFSILLVLIGARNQVSSNWELDFFPLTTFLTNVTCCSYFIIEA